MEKIINRRTKRGRNNPNKIKNLEDSRVLGNPKIMERKIENRVVPKGNVDTGININNEIKNNKHDHYMGMTMEQAENIKGVGNVGRYKPAWQ